MHSLVGRKNVLGPSREQPAGLNNHLLKNTVRNESPVQQYYGGASESTLPEIRRERNSSMQSLQGQQSQKRSGSTDERFNNYFEVSNSPQLQQSNCRESTQLARECRTPPFKRVAKMRIMTASTASYKRKKEAITSTGVARTASSNPIVTAFYSICECR